MSLIDFAEIMRRFNAGMIDADERERLMERAREVGRARQDAAADGAADGIIYYVITCCRIKIGYTTNLPRRLAELCPDELLATERGDRDTEALRHRQFAPYRVRGEWFRDCPALRAHVAAVKAGHHSAITDMPGERFIDTESALRWIGRPNRQTLYRWANEGRITRYGTPGAALWDILELPGRGRNGEPGPTPPRRA